MLIHALQPQVLTTCYLCISVRLGTVQELTTDRIVAEADLAKQLGTLRYLLGLRSARQRAEAALEQAVKQEEKGQGPEGTLPGHDVRVLDAPS